MSKRAAGFGIGVVFGVTLCWSGMSNPDVIRGALLLEQSYLFKFFAAAVATAAIGQWLIGHREITSERPQRRHIAGALIFGTGWAVADACPGPIATQLGQGIAWALLTAAGAVIGIRAFTRRHAVETEPPVEAPGNEAQRLAPSGAVN